MKGKIKRIPAGAKLRVLVVDDSAVIRRLVSQALSESPQIEVVGTAATGKIALQRIPQVNPDALTLDVEMPDMDGLETARQVKKANPDIRIVMFSTLTQRGATATLDALTSGADDYVTKASNHGSLNESMKSLRAELIPKLLQFFDFGAAPSAPPAVSFRRPDSPIVLPKQNGARLLNPRGVVIGVSTGGPTALSELVPQLPPNFPAPILIVQHMPPMFTRLLAERLQALTRLKVREAAAGMQIEPGTILIAPGDWHMRIVTDQGKSRVALDQGPPENSCRPAVDVLFRSAAESWQGQVVAVVLTGMGHDGMRGAECLRPLGAAVIAQDQPTSVVWGMPGAVATAGLADHILPLNEIAPRIGRYFSRGH